MSTLPPDDAERDYTLPPVPEKTIQQQWLDQCSASFDAWLATELTKQLPPEHYGAITAQAIDAATDFFSSIPYHLMSIITTAVTKKRVQDN